MVLLNPGKLLLSKLKFEADTLSQITILPLLDSTNQLLFVPVLFPSPPSSIHIGIVKQVEFHTSVVTVLPSFVVDVLSAADEVALVLSE